MSKVVFVSFAALLLAGCASDSRCGSSTKYRKAQSITPIQSSGGLQIPESPSALRVPPLTDAAVAAASQPLSGKRACLDMPPAIVVTPAPGTAAK